MVGKESFAILLLLCVASTLTVDSGQSISNGICSNMLHGRTDLFFRERNACLVYTTRDLADSKFFGKVGKRDDLLTCIRFVEDGVELQIPMVAVLHGQSLDAERQGFIIVVLLQVFIRQAEELAYLTPHARFDERRSQIRYRTGIASALGDHSFTDIGDGIVVDMRQVIDEAVCPILRRECDLLARDKLKAAMRAEVHHHIRFECFLCPQI